MSKRNKILVLGIGNIIRGDDGIGVHLAHRLKQILTADYVVKELAAISLDIMEEIAGFSKVVIIDAIKTAHGTPGQVFSLSLQEFKSTLNLSSSHGLDFKQLIELGKILKQEQMPAQVKILAVEAIKLNEFSRMLSPELARQFDKILANVRCEIESFKI